MKTPLLKKDEKIISKILFEQIQNYDKFIKYTKERIASGRYNIPANEKLLESQEKKRSELIKIYEKF